MGEVAERITFKEIFSGIKILFHLVRFERAFFEILLTNSLFVAGNVTSEFIKNGVGSNNHLKSSLYFLIEQWYRKEIFKNRLG